MAFLLAASFLVLFGTCLCQPTDVAGQEDALKNILDTLLGGSTNVLPPKCTHASYRCVPYYQCVDGFINTDGSGLIDVRTRPPAQCADPEYPDVPNICCQLPGTESTPAPIESCPGNQACVDYINCGGDGIIVTDGTGLIDIRTGFTSCWLPSGIGGRCCNPPAPFINSCPGTSICLSGFDCNGQAVDAINNFVDYFDTGLWSHCAYGSHEDGVCCRPKPEPILEFCPGDSVCLSPIDCAGTALDYQNTFLDFNPNGGQWSRCPLYDQGVCCKNPITIPDLPVAGHCGVRNYYIDQRISSNYAENEAAFGEFPWQAIIFYSNYTFKCGASLVSDRHLLTGAHCVRNLGPGDIRIRLGEYQVDAFDEPLPYIDRDVLQIYSHPDFNPKNLHNDMAILELLEPVKFKYNINTVCLPKATYIPDHQSPCFITGWGKEAFNGNFQRILKQVDVPFVHHSTCQDLLRKTRLGKFFRLNKSFVCAGGVANKDACYGDGGGPLVCKDPHTDRYILAGITAWGIECGLQDVPGVYVNVEYFTDWINNIISKSTHTIHGYGTN